MKKEELKKIDLIINRYKTLPSGPYKYMEGSDFDHWELWSEKDGVHLVQDDSGVNLSKDFIELLENGKSDIDFLIGVVKYLTQNMKCNREDKKCGGK